MRIARQSCRNLRAIAAAALVAIYLSMHLALVSTPTVAQDATMRRAMESDDRGPLRKVLRAKTNEILLEFQKKCRSGEALPKSIVFAGLQQHEPRITDTQRRRLNDEIMQGVGGNLIQPTELATLALLAPFLENNSKGQAELRKAEEQQNSAPLLIIASGRRPSTDVLQLELAFLDRREGCQSGDGIKRQFLVDLSKLEVVTSSGSDDYDVYELRGFYHEALREMSKRLSGVSMLLADANFDFSGECELRQQARSIFEGYYEDIRSEVAGILDATTLPPLADQDGQTVLQEIPETAAQIRLRFSPSSLSRNLVLAKLELVQKGLKQFVVNRNVFIDERVMSGCTPSVRTMATSTKVSSIKDCDGCPELISLGPGEFIMGSPDSDPDHEEDEGPQTKRQVAAIAISRSEVTVGQFNSFVAETGYIPSAKSGKEKSWCAAPESTKRLIRSKSRNHTQPGFSQNDANPVVCVSWHDAKAYAAWLSSKTGKSYRLLSEAEHEYMTRAGTTTRYWWGDVADAERANYQLEDGRTSQSTAGTVVTNALSANPWGFNHVSGNAAEWVEDCWNDRHDEQESSSAARLTGKCANRVIRGGGWTYSAKDIRSAARDNAGSEETFVDVGFRVARSLEN